MAKTDWTMNDTVLPADMNQIGEEINAKETPAGAQAKANTAQANANAYTDALIDQVTASGIPKLNTYPYVLTAVQDQTDFIIPLQTFDADTDTLLVSVNTVLLTPDAYTVTDAVYVDDELDEMGYITLGEPRNAGDIVYILVMKNVPVGEEGAINGRVLAVNSVPQDRIIGHGNLFLADGSVPLAGPLQFGDDRTSSMVYVFTQAENLSRNRLRIPISTYTSGRYTIEWSARSGVGVGNQRGGALEFSVERTSTSTVTISNVVLKTGAHPATGGTTRMGFPYVDGYSVVIPFSTYNNGTSSLYQISVFVTRVGILTPLPEVIDEPTSGSYPNAGGIYHDGNVVGIESSGNNANGRYVRYGDGTQICYGNVGGFGKLDADLTEGTWTYPATFNEVPRVLVSAIEEYTGVFVGFKTKARTVNTTVLRVWSPEIKPNYIGASLIAIGRWK